MKSNYIFAAILVLMSIFNCRKVEISDNTRIAGTWKLNSYLVNGIDKTGALLISDFTEKIEKDNFYGYSYWWIDANQDSIVERWSTYQLYANGDSVYFYTSFEIPLTTDDTVSHYRFCKILGLTKYTFVYEFQLNGRLHQFQMVPSEKKALHSRNAVRCSGRIVNVAPRLIANVGHKKAAASPQRETPQPYSFNPRNSLVEEHFLGHDALGGADREEVHAWAQVGMVEAIVCAFQTTDKFHLTTAEVGHSDTFDHVATIFSCDVHEACRWVWKHRHSHVGAQLLFCTCCGCAVGEAHRAHHAWHHKVQGRVDVSQFFLAAHVWVGQQAHSVEVAT